MTEEYKRQTNELFYNVTHRGSKVSEASLTELLAMQKGLEAFLVQAGMSASTLTTGCGRLTCLTTWITVASSLNKSGLRAAFPTYLVSHR